MEAQKKKKEPEPQKSAAPSTGSTEQEGSSAAPKEPTPIAMTNRRGKPLILARRGVRATGGLQVVHVLHQGETAIEAAPCGRTKCQLTCAGSLPPEAELHIAPGNVHMIGVETTCFQ